MSDPRPTNDDVGAPKYAASDIFLFWACFIALIATAFGFIVRTQIMDEWKIQFNLTETQKGEIFGAGLWPFAISIVLFSLVIDRIGYGKAMAFAFVCHISSAVVTIATPWLSGGDSRKAYWILYGGTFLGSLGNGTVEAVINPVVATIFSAKKPSGSTCFTPVGPAAWSSAASWRSQWARSTGNTRSRSSFCRSSLTVS